MYLGMITCDPLIQWTFRSLLFQTRRKNPYVYKGFKMPIAVNLSLLSGPVVVFDTVHIIA